MKESLLVEPLSTDEVEEQDEVKKEQVNSDLITLYFHQVR